MKKDYSEFDIRENRSLADLAPGSRATIVKIMPQARGGKKFADVGIVPGSELLIEAHAPFGGLIRVKVMECSMAIHRNEAADIIVQDTSSKNILACSTNTTICV